MAGCSGGIAARCDDGPNISFFHPGPLMPRMARALINRIPRFGALADAFAAPCGILICNLQGLDCSLLQGEAKPPPLHSSSVDAAVVDMPHCRSAKIMAESKGLLLQCLRGQIRV